MGVGVLRGWGSVSFVSRTRLAGRWRCRARGRPAVGGGESLCCLGWEREASGLAGTMLWVMQTTHLHGVSGLSARLCSDGERCSLSS